MLKIRSERFESRTAGILKSTISSISSRSLPAFRRNVLLPSSRHKS
jgi:hypothetical protein